MGFFIFKKRRLKLKSFLIICFALFSCFFLLLNSFTKQINEPESTKENSIKKFNRPKLSHKNLTDIINKHNTNQVVNNYYFIEKLLKTEYLNSQNKSNVSSGQTNTKYVYQSPKFFVILIQVHSRLNYLKELINSLSVTKHIDETLVIFSHDFYDEEINYLIKSIDFCATLQIFYPFSAQLYPNTFPGTDPNDCPKDVSKEKAKQMNCKNADFPDTFGHYRESKVVQIKHHWFWKINYVYDSLKITKNIQNLHVLLLEEDHYLFQDSIHVIRQLTKQILSDVDIVSMGYFKGKNQLFNRNELDLWSKGYWWASSNNIGVMFSRKYFEQIKSCSKMFCEYDDYNWDWSLQYIIQKCFRDLTVSLYPTFSRVAHFGECGTHFKGKECDPEVKLNEMRAKYQESKSSFFPEHLKFSGKIFGIRKIKKSNGGWSDPRDHELCKSFVKN